MSFFVTSVQAGDGGNLGGMAGADAHCQELAEGAGSRNREWRAYLSVVAETGRPAVNARDRIDKGPWFNAKGVQIAANVEDLHGPNNLIGLKNSLYETGRPVGYLHDMLTGSAPDGTAVSGDVTCRNWTRTSAHLSEDCRLPDFKSTGGAALFYCFAAN